MEKYNPYQSPKSSVLPQKIRSYCTDGKYLIIPTEQQKLPSRCVICNKPAIEPIKKQKLYYNPLFSLRFIPKKVIIYPGLCENHKRKEKVQLLIVATLYAVGLSILIYFNIENLKFMLLGIILIFIGILIFKLSKPLSIKKIKKELIYFKKCGSPFLDSLPKL